MTFTCDDTNRALKSGTELPAQALAHIATCELCQELVEVATDALPAELTEASTAGNSSKQEGNLPFDAMWKQLEHDVAGERGMLAWMRGRPTPVRLTAALCVALAPAAAQLVFARRVDIGHYPVPRFLVTAGTLVLVTVVIAEMQLAPLFLRRANWRRSAAVGLGLALPLAIAALAPAYDQVVEFPIAMQRGFWHQAFICMRFGLLLAAPCVVLMFAFDRQVARGRYFSTAVAALGGLAGNLLLFIHCPIEQAGHQLVGHAAIGFVFWCVVASVLYAFRTRRQ